MCECCNYGVIEILTHMFYDCDMTCKVWKWGTNIIIYLKADTCDVFSMVGDFLP